ncbi:MAG: aldo/keto reductase [Chloroflexi bacterium]|nr:aldo/keto reductase [Chloroflexota bacterium]
MTDEAVQIVNTAIDRGNRYFDTAWAYSNGQAEERLESFENIIHLVKSQNICWKAGEWDHPAEWQRRRLQKELAAFTMRD